MLQFTRGRLLEKNHLPMLQTVKHYVYKIYICIFFIRNVRQFATLVNGFFSKSLPLVNFNIQKYALKDGKIIFTKVANIQKVHLPLW